MPLLEYFDLQKLTRAQELDQDEANTGAILRRGSVPIDALETFLKRHTGKAEAEAEPLRSAQLGMVQELAALMVRHTAPAGAGLLGGTALVTGASVRQLAGLRWRDVPEVGEQLEAMREELNPGEVPECGSVCPDSPSLRCTRPRGHADNHEAWRDEGPAFSGSWKNRKG